MTSQGRTDDRTSRQMLLAAIAAFAIGGAMIGYGLLSAGPADPPAQVQSLVDDGNSGRGAGGGF